VITDNCTRQCLGLPLFMAGAQVPAAAVVAALRAMLPTELQFLISDRNMAHLSIPYSTVTLFAKFLG
jgi:hypothetical protein